MKEHNKIIVISGPTASGKTRLAVQIAWQLQSEIISADSRQVYKHLNIGTGKDLNDYVVNNQTIPYHLIDWVDINTPYHVAQYVNDFFNVYNQIKNHCIPILCGGTGLYIQSVLQNFQSVHIPVNSQLRQELSNKTHNELKEILKQFPSSVLNEKVDTSTTKRTIRAIEKANYIMHHGVQTKSVKPLDYLFFALNPSVELRRKNIELRLISRINNGLIEEAENLIKAGISHQRLQYFGLEYKYLSLYLLNKLSKQQLIQQLTTAIQQFAKRQMTFLRKMEKDGIRIIWLNQQNNFEQNLDFCMNHINEYIK
jgi:tRNA dimethylallyltransferase